MAVHQTDHYRGLAGLVRSYRSAGGTHWCCVSTRRNGIAATGFSERQPPGNTQSISYNFVGAHEPREAAMAVHQTDHYRGLAVLVSSYRSAGGTHGCCVGPRRSGIAATRFNERQPPATHRAISYNFVGAHEPREAAMAVYRTDRYAASRCSCAPTGPCVVRIGVVSLPSATGYQQLGSARDNPRQHTEHFIQLCRSARAPLGRDGGVSDRPLCGLEVLVCAYRSVRGTYWCCVVTKRNGLSATWFSERQPPATHRAFHTTD